MSRTNLSTFCRIADLPTAPFAEQHVAAYIRGLVARYPQLRMGTDPFGNLLVKYTPPKRGRARRSGRPILFAAHMDHPGFRAERMLDKHHVEASWRGGVQAAYFTKERIRFLVDGRWVPATIEKVILPRPPGRRRGAARSAATDVRPEAVIARVAHPVPAGSIGMWAIGDAVIRGGRVHARTCDDAAGVAAIVCTLEAICRRGIASPCYACFTRAEEVGFGGALTAVEARTIPQDALIVAVECSKALPSAPLGDGPVLRVGDKASVFTPAVTAYCQAVAERLMAGDKSFRYQRKLMDGGTCESTAYCHYGYEATCVCLPLANYHNMDVERRKIAPESVDTRDFINLVKLFTAIAAAPARQPFDGRDPVLGKRLDGLRRKHRRRLLKTPIR